MKSKLQTSFKASVLCVLMAILGNFAWAQTTVTIGSGTTTSSYYPIYSCYTYNYSQQICLASEITAGGATGPSYISKIRFQPSTVVSNTTWRNWEVYLGNTNLATFAGTSSWVPLTSLTPVYNDTIPGTLTSGQWMELTLNTPFFWDGASNLIVAVHENSPSYTCTNTWAAYSATAATGTRGILFYSDPTDPAPSAPPTANYTSSTIAQVQFDMALAAACSGAPTAGTATVSNSNPCSGNTVTLNLSGNSLGTGISYVWESSTSASGPWTAVNTAQVSPMYSISATATAYYRAAVTCGTQTSYSSPVLVTVPALFPGGTYTIDAASPASATNFQSFSAAVSAIACGIAGPVTFNVVASSTAYNEQITIPAINTTSTNTVTFNGNGDTLRFAGTGANLHTLGLNGADYFTFNNLVVEGTDGTYALVCHLWNQADHNSFNNCTFIAPANGTSSTQVPFSVSGSSSSATTSGLAGSFNTLNGCTIVSGYYNTVFYAGSSSMDTANKLVNCTLKDFYFYGSYNYYQKGLVVSNNVVERPTRSVLSTFYGIYLGTSCSNALIEKNIVRNPFASSPNYSASAYGIYVTSASSLGNENKVFNNVVGGLNNSGTTAGLYLTGATHIKAYHNTISIDNANATSGTMYGIYATGTSGVDIKNNNINVASSGSGTKYGLYFTGAGKTSNYNNIYVANATGTKYVGYYSSGFATLTAWQGANSGAWDQNSASVDPQFASVMAFNFVPTNSNLDNLGTPLTAVTTDILGAARSTSTPDMGAYEFTVPACMGTPIAGTVSGPAGVCANANFSMYVSGYSFGQGISIQWESSPAGVGLWTPIAGATNTNYTVTGGINTPTDYHAVVTCANGGGNDVTNTLSVTINPFYVCYCGPNTGVNLNSTTFNYLTNVTITNTTLNNTTTTPGPGSYSLFYPSTGSTTATLNQGVQYTLNTTHYYTGYYSSAWIDYDGDGTFSASEYIPITVNSYTGAATFIVPTTSTPGLTGLRIRTYYTTVTAGQACTASNSYETEDYVITIAVPPPCSGTPVAGNAYAPATVCSGIAFNLVDTAYTIASNMTVQWESSPAGVGAWSSIAGATNSTYTVTGGQTTATDYRMVLTCNGSGGFSYSNTVSVGMSPFYICYCSPLTNTTLHTYGYNYITNVNITGTTLNNSTTTVGNGGYMQAYPTTASTTTNLTQGIQYTLNATAQYTGYPIMGWVDMDGNGLFDAGEAVTMTPDAAGTLYSGTFTLPIGGITGNTGVRLRIGYNPGFTASQACFNYSSGYETEDYLINIVAPPPCNGVPSAGNAYGPANVCSGISFKLDDTAYTVGSGMMFQWESSPAGVGVWTAVSGATNPHFTMVSGQTTATDYRLVATCSNGGGSSISNTVSIGMNPFYVCYCSPLTGTTLHTNGYNYITNVSIAGSSFSNTTTTVGNNGYTQNYPTTTTTTTNIARGVQYTLNATAQYSSYPIVAWIDFDGSGTLDTGEFIPMTVTGGTNYSGTFVVPTTAVLGNTGLRVRIGYNPGFTNSQACYNYSSGYETEDYVVNVLPQPACLPVNTVVVSSVTASGATIGWVNPGSATQWTIEYGPVGFTQGTGTIVSTTTNPHTLTGLNSNTAYSVYITADCGSSTSMATGPVNFNTDQIPQSVFPYAQNWETGGSDWTFVNGTQANQWVVGTSAFYTGLKGLYVSQDGGLTNTYNINSASVVSAFRDLDLSSFSAAVPLAFNWKGYGENNYDWLRVFVVPTTYYPVAGVTLNGALPTGGVQLTPTANGFNLASTWQSAFLNIPASFAGTTARLVLEWRNDPSVGTQSPAAVDGLTIGGNPLSIGLADIKASNAGTKNRIDWNTASEMQGDRFELERSADGRNFTYLASINAKGEASTYSYWDEKPVSGVNYYRLKMLDAAGDVAYSKIVTATVKEGTFTVEAYPNPVSDVLTVKAFGSTANNAMVTVSDATGKVVKVVTMTNGIAEINMNGLAQGIYLVKYSDSDHSEVIKVNKK